MRFPDSKWFERRATAKYHPWTGSGLFSFTPDRGRDLHHHHYGREIKPSEIFLPEVPCRKFPVAGGHGSNGYGILFSASSSVGRWHSTQFDRFGKAPIVEIFAASG
jgi:hypothetical protein